jgi:hypothetical protein
MNRLILKYGYPITAVILLIFVWVIAQRATGGWAALAPLVIAAVIVWAVGAPAFIWFWPRITVNGFRRAIVRRGFGGGPIPVNTLYAEPRRSSASASTGSLMGTGTDDVLYIAGWFELRERPVVVHVPEMTGRYFSLQFTDPSTGANFAYIGTRATGSAAGDFLITAAGWAGQAPSGLTRIQAPGRSALVIGRVFVADQEDQPAAYGLAQQITAAPLGS